MATREPIASRPAGVETQATGTVISAKSQKYQKSRRTGASVDYRPDISGNLFAVRMADDIEREFRKMLWRGDPRKIIRGLAKRSGATEEAVAFVLYRRLMQYRAESLEFRRQIERMREFLAEMVKAVDEAGQEIWRRKIA